MTTDTIQETKPFRKMLPLGKLAETKFREWMTPRLKPGQTLHDTSDIPAFQKLDVDFVLQKTPDVDFTFENVVTRPNDFLKIEIKYDATANRTGNLALCLWNKGKLGWALRTWADIVFVFVVDADYSRNEITKYHNMIAISMKCWRERLFKPGMFKPTKPRVEWEGKYFIDQLDRIDDLAKEEVCRVFPVDW